MCWIKRASDEKSVSVGRLFQIFTTRLVKRRRTNNATGMLLVYSIRVPNPLVMCVVLLSNESDAIVLVQPNRILYHHILSLQADVATLWSKTIEHFTICMFAKFMDPFCETALDPFDCFDITFEAPRLSVPHPAINW